MRTYPTNSPQAAARIVALAMVADGNLSKVELDVLDRLGAHDTLGLKLGDLQTILRDFCDDLLHAADLSWAVACHIDPQTLGHLMAEIDDPALRRTVFNLCVAVIEADDHLADGESIVLQAAAEHWDLHEDVLEPTTTT